jgi:hypothetical protein
MGRIAKWVEEYKNGALGFNPNYKKTQILAKMPKILYTDPY